MVNDNRTNNLPNIHNLANYQAIRNRRRRRETIFGNQIANRRLSSSPVIEVYSDSEEDTEKPDRGEAKAASEATEEDYTYAECVG